MSKYTDGGVYTVLARLIQTMALWAKTEDKVWQKVAVMANWKMDKISELKTKAAEIGQGNLTDMHWLQSNDKHINLMMALAKEKGVKFEFNQNVESIHHNGSMNVATQTRSFTSDFVIGGADYAHIDQKLLSENDQQYSDTYWDKRVMSPSSLLFYVGVNKRVKGLLHHNLFFDADFHAHAKEIYKTKQWPEQPLFYVCAPSVTDPSVAPEGHENLFFLVPIAAGIEGDTEEKRNHYFDLILDRIKKHTGEDLRDHIVYKRSYAKSEFVKDYNAFKGNAYGLANTLLQTAFLKPRIQHKKIKQLYFTGQLTAPGPGVPPSLISGQVVADHIVKHYNSN